MGTRDNPWGCRLALLHMPALIDDELPIRDIWLHQPVGRQKP